MSIIYESDDSYDNVDLEWVRDQFPEIEEEMEVVLHKKIDDQIVLNESSHELLKFYF